MTEAERGSVAWTQALLLSLIGAAQTGARRQLELALETALAADFQPDALEVATMLLGFGAAFGDHAGEIRKSDALVKRSEALVGPRADQEPAAALFHHLIVTTRAAFANEDPWSGLEHARKAHALALSIGHTRYALGSKMLILVNSCFLGAHAEAWRSVAEWDVPDGEFGLSSSVRPFVLSWTLADMGFLEEAHAWAEHLIAAGQARGLPLDEARGLWVLGEVRRRMGDLENADAALAEALPTLAEVCPLDQPAALASLAALRLAQGRPDEALAAAEGGMAQYLSRGACGMFRGAFLRLVHVGVLKRLGRESEERAAIAEARRHVLANAEKIPDPRFRASFLGQVPENRRTLELARARGE
jgi:tetratricopeptide (TPR) repeat protein